MKKVLFEDMNRKVIQVSQSGAGNCRIYINPDDENSPCIHLDENQSKILVHAILDLWNRPDE